MIFFLLKCHFETYNFIAFFKYLFLGQLISLHQQNIMKYLVFQDMPQIKTLKKHITNWPKNITQMQIKVIKLLRKNFKKSPMHMRRLFINKFGMIHLLKSQTIFIKHMENINMVAADQMMWMNLSILELIKTVVKNFTKLKIPMSISRSQLKEFSTKF